MNAVATRGYYSLVQFCPDASRAEAVNLGVVLFCPELPFLDAILTRGTDRAAKLVGREKLDRAALQGAKRALERRFKIDRAAFQTLEDFQKFVATRGNALQLTVPRPVKVSQPQTELNELFQSLVGGTPRRNSKARTMFPKLDSAFRQLADEKLAELHVPITVPVLGKIRHIPYAYQNGVWNLIEPKRFSGSVQTAVDTASRLAMEGDLLRRHGIEGRGKTNLIVVPLFEESTCIPVLQQRVGEVLNEYKVETVGENQIDEFLARVRREAHEPCERE